MNIQESLMTCYKCTSDKELSIKARNRDGTIRIKICRQCRRNEHHDKLYAKQPRQPKSKKDIWAAYAKEINNKVMNSYG